MASTTPRSISQHVVDDLIDAEGLEHDCALLVVVYDSEVRHMSRYWLPQASAVPGARRWARDQLESCGLDQEVAATAVSGVSEPVTKRGATRRHTARVSMELADRLLATVEDTGTRDAPPPQTRVDRSASRGSGLALVAAISDAMGHSQGVRGSTVWFEIERNP